MTIAKEVVYALHQRLKDLSVNATPDQLAYLAKSLESIAGQSTVLDIVQMTDAKLKELLDSATKHLSDLDTSKTSSLSAITAAKTGSLTEINTLKTESLNALKTSSDSHISLLDTRKNTNIAAINSTGTEQLSILKGLVKNFEAVNDVPNGSSIMAEVKNRSVVESESLPFLFGVLARHNHYWSYGSFTTELGQWYKDTAKTDNMLQLLTGSHNYSTQYVAFYKPPQLHFLQGKNGTFVYNELYLRYAHTSNQYQYPYALIGVVFVKNTTGGDITRALDFAATSHWSSGYEGVGLFVGTPNNTDANKSAISAINWSNIYNYSSTNSFFTGLGNVQIPANKTVAIILYTTPYQHYQNYSYYSQYMQWGIHNFRSNFLTTGLEVDVERTLRAWQCPGLSNTYEIWR